MTRKIGRRRFLQAAGAASVLPALASCIGRAQPRAVVVGAGFGGATCAHYLKLLDPKIDVTLIERNKTYTTCPRSNNVIGGLEPFDDLVHGFEGLKGRGINVVQDTVTAVDAEARKLTLESGGSVPYDRLVLSPGIDFVWNGIEGYDELAAEVMPHAYKAGPQTLLLKKQLESVENGKIVIIVAPDNPYRCPPAPYERASMFAHYFKSSGKDRCKIFILDHKDKFTKMDLFMQGWERFYPGMIEWVPGSKGGTVTRVDPKAMTVYAEGGEYQAVLVNVIPPQSAGKIALDAGLATVDGWCGIEPWTMESRVKKNIHVIGDSCWPDAMPKSGFAANSQAKICAAAVGALLRGDKPTEPVFMNICYSTIAPNYAVSINDTYRVSNDRIVALRGSGAESPLDASDAVRAAEYDYAEGWYASIMKEMYG